MAFARFNAVPHYAYLKLKMPGPHGVIMINGNTERSLRTEEDIATLAAEVQNGLFKPNSSSVVKTTTQLNMSGIRLSAAAQINPSSISSYTPIDCPIR